MGMTTVDLMGHSMDEMMAEMLVSSKALGMGMQMAVTMESDSVCMMEMKMVIYLVASRVDWLGNTMGRMMAYYSDLRMVDAMAGV